MTVVNPKSISGITSITTASGSDDLLTIHTNNGTERLRVDSTGATKIVTGIVTTLTATTGIVTTLTANTVTSLGAVSGTTGTFSGAVSGTTGTFSGAVSGTTGTFSGDVNISDTIYHTGDTNTKIRFPAADTITAETGGTERLRIDSSGRLLIGSTAKAGDSALQVYSSDKLHPAIRVHSSNANGFTMFGDAYQADESNINFGISYSSASLVISQGCKVSTSSDDAYVSSQDSYSTKPNVFRVDTDGSFSFLNTNTSATTTTDSAVSLTERVRITSSGDMGVGTNSPDRKLDVSGTGNVYGKFQSTNATGAGIEVKDSGQDWLIQADNGGSQSSLAFYDLGNTAYRVHMKDNGNLEIVNGNLKVASGKGIDFSATSDASGASSEVLDDYEEGTWTPTNTIGLTLTNNNPAYYIKIGKLVMIQFDVSFSGASDTAQCGVIQSLPFTSENTTNHFSQGPLPHISTNSNFDLDPNLDDLLLFIGPNESRIDIFSFSINAQAARSSLVGRRIRHQMIYKAA